MLIDTNLLIYAVNRDAPQHDQARNWLEQTLSNNTIVGIPWLVSIAFLRLTTNPRVMQSPITIEQALNFVNGWLQQPYVMAINPGEQHWAILNKLLMNTGAAGNLTNDAHLAAIAIEHGYVIASSDNDFKRFEGIEHINPLEIGGIHEAGPRKR